MFAGIKRKVVVHENYAHFRPGIDVIMLMSGRYYAHTAQVGTVIRTDGRGNTFQEAVSDFEANALATFKALGELLNYDVED